MRNRKQYEWGCYAEKKAEPNRSQLFKTLRTILYKRRPTMTNIKLSEILEIPPQQTSLYASGSDRQAPWWAIMRLCQMINKQVTFTPTEIRIEEYKPRK